jgi:hypothetical protein
LLLHAALGNAVVCSICRKRGSVFWGAFHGLGMMYIMDALMLGNSPHLY